MERSPNDAAYVLGRLYGTLRMILGETLPERAVAEAASRPSANFLYYYTLSWQTLMAMADGPERKHLHGLLAERYAAAGKPPERLPDEARDSFLAGYRNPE